VYDSRGAPWCLFGTWLSALVVSLLASCGSDEVASPTPAPSEETRAFVHLLDPKQGALSTFSVDPLTGELTLADTTAVPNVPDSAPLASDPRGRFVYVYGNPNPYGVEGSLRSYRVDGLSGRLILASKAPTKGFYLSYLATLAASAGRLYFSGDDWSGTGDWDNLLGVFAVEETGILADGRVLIRDWEDSGKFNSLLGVPTAHDVVLAGYHWGCQLRALALDAIASGGYREVARMDLGDSAFGPTCFDSSVVAAEGRVFLTDGQGTLFSYVLDEAEGTFDGRGQVAAAGSPASFRAPDRLAVLTPVRWDEYESAGQKHLHQTTSIALYGVGAEGELSLPSRLPESYFVFQTWSPARPWPFTRPAGSSTPAAGRPPAPRGAASCLERRTS
jgi:hypothetical protein